MPQGTKLDVILSKVMTKKLLSDWQPRIKFVDDTSALKIIQSKKLYIKEKKNVASNIHSFTMTRHNETHSN